MNVKVFVLLLVRTLKCACAILDDKRDIAEAALLKMASDQEKAARVCMMRCKNKAVTSD
jgi:hypothetical protein